ncbi:MAG: hypothetical protein ACRD96_22710, partial [Bryobacteraceae bacterium]
MDSVTTTGYEDDYPSLASDGSNLFLAWQGYNADSDRVFLREQSGGRWGEPVEVTEKPADVFMTAVTAAAGRVTVIWSERDGANWHLKARTRASGAWSAVETLTSGDGANFFHRAAAGSDGGIHVVYQSTRRALSDIYLRSFTGGRWSREIRISESPTSDWSPAVAVDHAGVAWVAWDSYATGSYNVLLRGVRNGRPGDVVRVTDSTRFHAHPTLAVDSQNRVWVAWDEAPENWGKDVGFLLTGGTGLYDSRTIKVSAYAGGRWATPLRQPGDMVPYGYRRYFHTPRLVADGAGSIWLLARPRTSARLPTTLWAAGGKWEVVATRYSGDRWSDLQIVPGSVGRNEGEIAAVADSGSVAVALVSDHRSWGGPNFGDAPRNNDVLFARLRTAEPSAAAQVAPR